MESHLLQMRGLKPTGRCYPFWYTKVASFTDAWIETPVYFKVCDKNGCRIFYRCVD